MGYRVKGTLKLPDGSPASNAEIEFISRKNFSPLVQELKSNILCGLDGAYDVTLEFGEYAVMVYPGGTYPEALGTIVLAADTVAGQDLPTLLQQAGWQPATPEYIQQIAAWLAEANASATSSASSAGAAKVSETNAKASENAALSSKNSAASSASTATTKAAEAASSASAALASKNAAATSEANALASKNSAATSATTASAGASTATTKASEAASSAAAAKVSEDAARVSETNAAVSASAAASAIVTHEGKAGAHHISGVTGLQAALDGKYSPANKPTAADVTGLDEALNTKLDKASVVAPMANGGVIERGSNANGEFVKFADGTLICSHVFEGSVMLSYATAQGIYVGDILPPVPYPMAFSELPAAEVRFYPKEQVTLWASYSGYPTNTHWPSVYPFSELRTSVPVNNLVSRSATGRWK